MKVMVIGGAGYLGSVLTRQLLAEGDEVLVYDSFLFGEEPLDEIKNNPRLRIVKGDICDLSGLVRRMKGHDAVVHLAALVGEKACDRDPVQTIAVNDAATLAAAEAASALGIRRFIFASTDSAYGIQEGIMTEDSPLSPISLYARLKADIETKIVSLRNRTFAPCILRMATLYGLSPRMRFDLIVNILTLHAVTRKKITIFGGKQWRPLCHVRDAARSYISALKAPLDVVGGEIFNVGCNEQNYRIEDLGRIVCEVIPGLEVQTIPQNPDLRDYHVNFDKIGKALNYQITISMEDGIREIQRALQEHQIEDVLHPKYCNA